MKPSNTLMLAAMAAVATVMGCEPKPVLERVEVTSKTTAPLEASVTSQRITLTHGTGLAFSFKVYSNEGGQEAYDPARLRVTGAAEKIVVEKVSDDLYLLFGVTPGDADVQISANDSSADGLISLPVTVLPQAP